MRKILSYYNNRLSVKNPLFIMAFMISVISTFMLCYDFSHSLMYLICLLLCVSCATGVNQSLDEIKDKALRKKDGSSTCQDFVSLVGDWLRKIEVT